MNKILLITLFRNRDKLFRKAVSSVLQQTLNSQKFDYLLFNNGSEDFSEQLAKIYQSKYHHIHLFGSPTNLGQQPAYNKILFDIIPKHFQQSTVVGILDDDDELQPIALQEVLKTYNVHPDIGAAYSGFSIIDGWGRVIVPDHGKAKMAPNQYTPEGQLALRKMFVSPKSNPCGHFRTYSIKALNEVGGFPTQRKFATDYCIFGSIMEKYPVVKIDEVLYKFRQHNFGQVQSTDSPQQTADWHYYQKYFRERWKKMKLI
jgi:glycosyltransferase involved in cell wall biosynthesis